MMRLRIQEVRSGTVSENIYLHNMAIQQSGSLEVTIHFFFRLYLKSKKIIQGVGRTIIGYSNQGEILVAETTERFMDQGKLNVLMVVRFQVKAKFQYCPRWASKKMLNIKVVKIDPKIIISLQGCSKQKICYGRGADFVLLTQSY